TTVPPVAVVAPAPASGSAPAPASAPPADLSPIRSPFLDVPVTPPAVPAPDPGAAEPVPSPFLDRPVSDAAPLPVAAPPAVPVDPADPEGPDEADDAAETIVVHRPAVTTWVLLTDDGERFPLEADIVVLGRRPSGDEPGVQYLAIPDTTRTLSKQHACLTRDGDGWTVADLDSTNGVFLEQDGRERRVAAGGSTELVGRLLLGSVGLRLERGEGR
ncbi:FHA domain-containing protein, partial [Leifsonia aquatica]|uniref:FHA domain-containing protein n=1 Tax=Leifsonia aquatica TaxID=144185 RepID=UPI00046A76DA